MPTSTEPTSSDLTPVQRRQQLVEILARGALRLVRQCQADADKQPQNRCWRGSSGMSHDARDPFPDREQRHPQSEPGAIRGREDYRRRDFLRSVLRRRRPSDRCGRQALRRRGRQIRRRAVDRLSRSRPAAAAHAAPAFDPFVRPRCRLGDDRQQVTTERDLASGRRSPRSHGLSLAPLTSPSERLAPDRNHAGRAAA